MRPSTKLLQFLACSAFIASAHTFSTANAAVLASYAFNSGSAAVTSSTANLTAGNFSFATGFTTNTGFSATGGNMFARTNATSSANLTGAIAGDDFITVTITPNSGFQLNLTNLTVDLGYTRNGGATQSLSASVFSSVDGFAAANVLGTVNSSTTVTGDVYVYQNLNINLAGASFQGLTDPLEFRIYFYDDADSVQPIHRVDNFILNGAVAAIPEPGAALLGGLGLLVLLRRRR